MTMTLTFNTMAVTPALNAGAAQAGSGRQPWCCAGEKVMVTLVARCEAQNPGIDIEPVSIGACVNGAVRLEAAAVSGDAPALARAHLAPNPKRSAAVTQLKDAFVRAQPRAIRAVEPTMWERIVLKQAAAVEALGAFYAEIDRLMVTNSPNPRYRSRA